MECKLLCQASLVSVVICVHLVLYAWRCEIATPSKYRTQLSSSTALSSGTSTSTLASYYFFLISVILPLLCEYIRETEQRTQERLERHALVQAQNAAEHASRVTLRVRRVLERNQEQRQLRRQVSIYQHDRTRQAIQQDFFSPLPVFNDRQFERLYRVTKTIFQKLLEVCAFADPFFTDQHDAARRFNICPKAKVLMALKVIAYGCSPSAFIDYLQMSISTARTSVLKFAAIVSNNETLCSIFLRKMTRADAQRVSRMHQEQHGVAGMIGSLDCMHVCWKNCPVAWQGSQSGKAGM